MVKYAHDKGIYTITSTNGHFLHPDNARRLLNRDWIAFLYQLMVLPVMCMNSIARKRTDTVLQGAENLVQAKEMNSSTPHIVFQMLVAKPNEHQIEEVRRMASEIA
jgi:pyruvate-formate lyase-activating enzyme